MTMCMTCGGRQAPARGDVPCRCGRFAQPIYDRGHRDGFDAAVRLFWQGVCEEMARPLGEEASEREGYARGWRALLERDVAEVERELAGLLDSALRTQRGVAIFSEVARDGASDPRWENTTRTISQEQAEAHYATARRCAERYHGAAAWLARARAVLS